MKKNLTRDFLALKSENVMIKAAFRKFVVFIKIVRVSLERNNGEKGV